MLRWKQHKKAEGLMRSASQKLGLNLDDLYEKTWSTLEDAFGGVYEGLEKTAREGYEVLVEKGIPEDISHVLDEIAKEKIKISSVKIRGLLNISCTKPDGVLRIKEALVKAKNVKGPLGTDVKIYLVAPPKYRLEVKASNYKQANALLKKVSEVAIKDIHQAGGQGVFQRG
jgi:translation initiation factor 2 subunit 1